MATRARRPLPPTPGAAAPSPGVSASSGVRGPVNIKNKAPPPEPLYEDGSAFIATQPVEPPRLPQRHAPPIPQLQPDSPSVEYELETAPAQDWDDDFNHPEYDDFDPTCKSAPILPVSTKKVMPTVKRPLPPVPGIPSGQRPSPVGAVTAAVSNVHQDADDVYEEEPQPIPISAAQRPQPQGMAKPSGSISKAQTHSRPLRAQPSGMHKAPEPQKSPAASLPTPEVYEDLDEVSGPQSMDFYEDPDELVNRAGGRYREEIPPPPPPNKTPPRPNVAQNSRVPNLSQASRPPGLANAKSPLFDLAQIKNVKLRKTASFDEESKEASPPRKDPEQTQNENPFKNMLRKTQFAHILKQPDAENSTESSQTTTNTENNKPGFVNRDRNENIKDQNTVLMPNGIQQPVSNASNKPVVANRVAAWKSAHSNTLAHKDAEVTNSTPAVKPKPVTAVKPEVNANQNHAFEKKKNIDNSSQESRISGIGKVKIPQGFAEKMGDTSLKNRTNTPSTTPRTETPPLPPPPSTEDLPPPLPPDRPVKTMPNVHVPDSHVGLQKDTQVQSGEDLSCYPWYHGNLTRTETEKRLRSHGGDGVFLVRRSKQGSPEQPYTMSILYHDSIYTLKVRRRPDGDIAMGEEKLHENTFGSVSSMIAHHTNNDVILIGNPSGRTTLTGYPQR